MGYDVALATAVQRLEKDLATRAPYLIRKEDQIIDYWVCKNQTQSKVVLIVPEQPLTEKDMEAFCALVHEQPYTERIVYTNETRYSLGRGVTIKPLPNFVDNCQ